MKPKILCNGLIFNDGLRFRGAITIFDGMIKKVEGGVIDPSTISRENYEVVDLRGKMVLPGFIDTHVHFREPGFSEKGDIRSESMAAVAGGVTTFFDMPNNIPPTTTIEAWNDKMRRASENSLANYAFYLGVTDDNIDELLRADYTHIPGVKLFMGSSTGNMLVDNDDSIRRLFEEFPGVIAVHAESEAEIARNKALLSERYPDGIPVGLHHLVRSREACVAATTKAVELARETGARLHVLHVTTADELELFSAGAVEGKLITAETCPHYLYFDSSSVESTGGLTKCNPAIKGIEDRKALRHAVADGVIDTIGTDHAPHQLFQKRVNNALKAASGMPSVQFAFPLMLQLANRGCFTYEDVAEKMAHNPARIFNIDRRGFIRPNYWADLAVVNPDADYELHSSEVISPCGWTPYEGVRLRFRVEQTWINGDLAYNRGRFPGDHTPLAVRFSPSHY